MDDLKRLMSDQGKNFEVHRVVDQQKEQYQKV
jgi:hypothetical protein